MFWATHGVCRDGALRWIKLYLPPSESSGSRPPRAGRPSPRAPSPWAPSGCSEKKGQLSERAQVITSVRGGRRAGFGPQGCACIIRLALNQRDVTFPLCSGPDGPGFIPWLAHSGNHVASRRTEVVICRGQPSVGTPLPTDPPAPWPECSRCSWRIFEGLPVLTLSTPAAPSGVPCSLLRR